MIQLTYNESSLQPYRNGFLGRADLSIRELASSTTSLMSLFWINSVSLSKSLGDQILIHRLLSPSYPSPFGVQGRNTSSLVRRKLRTFQVKRTRDSIGLKAIQRRVTRSYNYMHTLRGSHRLPDWGRVLGSTKCEPPKRLNVQAWGPVVFGYIFFSGS